MKKVDKGYESYVKAFSIFAKYISDYDHVAAEHDIIYAGPDPIVVSIEDVKRLKELGWLLDRDLECFYHYV